MEKEEVKPIFIEFKTLSRLSRLSKEEIKKEYHGRLQVTIDKSGTKKIYDKECKETFISGETDMMCYYDITTKSGDNNYRIIWGKDGKKICILFAGAQVDLKEGLEAFYERRKPRINSVFGNYFDVIDFINGVGEYSSSRVDFTGCSNSLVQRITYTDQLTKDTLSTIETSRSNGQYFEALESMVVTINGQVFCYNSDRNMKTDRPHPRFLIDGNGVKDEVEFIKRFNKKERPYLKLQ